MKDNIVYLSSNELAREDHIKQKYMYAGEKKSFKSNCEYSRLCSCIKLIMIMHQQNEILNHEY